MKARRHRGHKRTVLLCCFFRVTAGYVEMHEGEEGEKVLDYLAEICKTIEF